MSQPVILITVDGRPALTVEQAAQRYGLKPAPMRTQLARFGERISPAIYLDGRKPLYDQAQLDALMAARPGKGAPGEARPGRALAALRRNAAPAAPADQ